MVHYRVGTGLDEIEQQIDIDKDRLTSPRLTMENYSHRSLLGLLRIFLGEALT